MQLKTLVFFTFNSLYPSASLLQYGRTCLSSLKCLGKRTRCTSDVVSVTLIIYCKWLRYNIIIFQYKICFINIIIIFYIFLQEIDFTIKDIFIFKLIMNVNCSSLIYLIIKISLGPRFKCNKNIYKICKTIFFTKICLL